MLNISSHYARVMHEQMRVEQTNKAENVSLLTFGRWDWSEGIGDERRNLVVANEEYQGPDEKQSTNTPVDAVTVSCAAVSSIQGSLHYTPCEPIAQLPKSFLLLERRRKWRMEIGEKHNLLGAERP